MKAPLALNPCRGERTDTLERWPASRATPMISTVPSDSSGTSSAKSRRTRFGWLRDSVICGPFMPLATETT
jgi:hypothetical protein